MSSLHETEPSCIVNTLLSTRCKDVVRMTPEHISWIPTNFTLVEFPGKNNIKLPILIDFDRLSGTSQLITGMVRNVL